jgi:hypothetical protein
MKYIIIISLSITLFQCSSKKIIDPEIDVDLVKYKLFDDYIYIQLNVENNSNEAIYVLLDDYNIETMDIDNNEINIFLEAGYLKSYFIDDQNNVYIPLNKQHPKKNQEVHCGQNVYISLELKITNENNIVFEQNNQINGINGLVYFKDRYFYKMTGYKTYDDLMKKINDKAFKLNYKRNINNDSLLD